jgi:AbrB family looped-hinge helix DNA binding protein
MLSAKVSTKHQIAIPSEARRKLGIEPGDRLSVEITEDTLILRRRHARPSERLRGMARGMYEGLDAVEYVRRLRAEWDD